MLLQQVFYQNKMLNNNQNENQKLNIKSFKKDFNYYLKEVLY